VSDPFGPDRKGKGLQPIQSYLPGATREERAARFIASLEEKREKSRDYSPHYSTQYARALCKERGWKVLQSEYRDQRGNLRDVPYGADVMAQDGNRLVFVQASCKGGKAHHLRRFHDRTDALPMGARFLYIEFARTGEILLEEEWFK
jgi:hypothetical protein